jgi:hypothetical protein
MFRESQYKYECWDDFEYEFEVVAYSNKGTTGMGSIGKQPIQVLADNGVVCRF